MLASVTLPIATDRSSVAATANRPVSDGTAFVIEPTLTAIFVAVTLHASRNTTFGSSARVAIPLTLVAVHLAATPFSGCSSTPRGRSARPRRRDVDQLLDLRSRRAPRRRDRGRRALGGRRGETRAARVAGGGG